MIHQTAELLPRPEEESRLHRPSATEMPILGRIGSLEARLAKRKSEIEAAQELGASISDENRRLRRDVDRYDRICDHILVLDTAIDGPDEIQVVGTYRLLTDRVATRNFGFYSAGEFAVDKLIGRHPGKCFMELGRSCVLPEYRTRRTLELLWQGNWAYACSNGIDVMFGCASFPGTDPGRHALPLSFLRLHCGAPPEWDVSALPRHRWSMDLIPSEQIDRRTALSAMPPLIKGYLRLGAMVGDGAFIDRDFGTTDVMIVLPTERINKRYLDHYGNDAERFAGTVPGYRMATATGSGDGK